MPADLELIVGSKSGAEIFITPVSLAKAKDTAVYWVGITRRLALWRFTPDFPELFAGGFAKIRLILGDAQASSREERWFSSRWRSNPFLGGAMSTSDRSKIAILPRSRSSIPVLGSTVRSSRKASLSIASPKSSPHDPTTNIDASNNRELRI